MGSLFGTGGWVQKTIEDVFDQVMKSICIFPLLLLNKSEGNKINGLAKAMKYGKKVLISNRT